MDLRIELAPLSHGQHQLELAPEPADLELDEERFSDIHVRVFLDYAERRVLAAFDVSASATLECDRTLKLFDQDVSGSHSVLFAPAEVVADQEEADDSVAVLDPEAESIDLAQPVRDTLLLALPARCVAPGAEDVDLPTHFGTPEGEEAIDPRWEALRQLRDES